MLLISIYQHIYEVQKFVKLHPGEGIKQTYLREYKRRESTDEFERYHNTNEADEMLELAREEGYNEEAGIYYVCPFFFKKKIPKYFKFFPEDPYGKTFLQDKPVNTFILRPSNSDRLKSVSLTYKDDEGEILQLKIRLTSDKIWYTQWEDDDGETIDISETNLEDVIDRTMLQNGYQAI